MVHSVTRCEWFCEFYIFSVFPAFLSFYGRTSHGWLAMMTQSQRWTFDAERHCLGPQQFPVDLVANSTLSCFFFFSTTKEHQEVFDCDEMWKSSVMFCPAMTDNSDAAAGRRRSIRSCSERASRFSTGYVTVCVVMALLYYCSKRWGLLICLLCELRWPQWRLGLQLQRRERDSVKAAPALMSAHLQYSWQWKSDTEFRRSFYIFFTNLEDPTVDKPGFCFLSRAWLRVDGALTHK